MIFGKLIKQNKIAVSYRLTEKIKNYIGLMTTSVNWKLKYSGCENQVTDTTMIESSISSVCSGNQYILQIGSRLYTIKDIFKEYIDEIGIKRLEEFLGCKEKINENLESLFAEVLLSKLEYFNEMYGTNLSVIEESNICECFQEIDGQDEDLKKEIMNEFESKLYEQLEFNESIVEYAREENYKFEQLEFNNNRLGKLIDLYLYKQEYKGILLGNRKEKYKGEFEKFITSECKDMTIVGYSNGR